MRNVMIYMLGCFFCSCVAFAQETAAVPMDQQFRVLVEEIEGWKKEMTQSVASRTSIEPLLRQGVTFQKSYNAETDSIVKGDLLDEYVKHRAAALKKLPVTVFMSYGRDAASSYPFALAFEKDDLEVDAKRPLLLQRKASNVLGLDTPQARRRMLFSYKESQRFANLLGRLVAKAKTKEAMNVSLRDFVVSVQILPDTEAAIFLQFKTPTGTVSPEMHRLTEFDAKLLIDRINATLAASPPAADYKEPDDLDPATALFVSPVDDQPSSKADVSAGAGAIAVNLLGFDVAKIRSTQGQPYTYRDKVLQQFDYRVSFRWGGTQPLNVQVIMYLVSPVNNKLSIVGRSVKETTLEPGRNQELLITAEQKIPGPTAGTVIMQCFSGGRLLKSYSSNAQHRKFAEMAEIESQLPPLYQNPQYVPTVVR